MVFLTQDTESVSKILNHPKVYRMITDDCSPSRFNPEPHEMYIMNQEKTGIFRIDPLNGISCIVHIATLPELWGKTERFCRESIEWLFSHTAFTKIIALVPEFNTLAIRLCKKCEMSQEGVIKRSFLKGWKYYDQIVYGLTKGA